MIQFRRIYLIGFMGSGKTTAGKKLATTLGWPFLDLDDIIEQKYSKSIEEIFMLSGEKTFREYEKSCLHNLGTEEDTVVSAGGGAPCFSDNMTFMNQTGRVVYLRMSPLQLKERLLSDPKPRPLLKGLNPSELERYIELKLSEREAFYNQAFLIEDGYDLDISKLAKKIIQLFSVRRK